MFKATIEREEYVYSTESFIGALGGYLGLFLGGSILGIVEYIEVSMTKSKTIIKK